MTVAADTMLDVSGDPTDLARELAERRIGDGLPVVVATPERVDRMLAGTTRGPDEVLGYMPPIQGLVTPRYIAVNGVLAGCSPEHMPVLLAIAEALMAPEYNLFAIQPTTNPVTPLVMVHGPIRERLGMNWGAGCFGPGNYANAVIGRAVRFLLQNLGGGIPGKTDQATHGWPGKYSFCAAENQAQTPWEPYHVRVGLDAEDSAVTLFAVQAQHNIIDVTGQNGYEALNVIGRGMAAVGSNNHTMGGEALVVLCPEQAKQIADSGLGPKEAAEILFEHARIDMRGMPTPFQELIATRRPDWVDMSRLPIVDRPEDIQIIVAGGPGVHALYMASFALTKAVTRRID
ncbi:hypothetical protein GCM10009775_07200 [Microbacterium aoyamense]|uniref:Uncharacterized protein n=1 Tax=Microbacterium aoyamense TaxID=344166 RepID=A0ABP5AM79_9MICO|nr:hypothetical protein [Microbacterium aoyamense]